MDGVTTWLRERSPQLAAGLALATVATVAGVVSYTHIDALTLALGGSQRVSHLMPFAVDGQIAMGSVVLLVTRGRRAWWGWLGIGPGLAESLFANFESGIRHGLLAAAWYTVPAQAFAVASFLFERWLKSQVTGVASVASPNVLSSDGGSEVAEPDPCPHYVASTADEAAIQAYLHSRDCLRAPLSQRTVSDQFGISRPRVAELVKAALNGHAEPSPEEVAASA
jgi:hypothetical protein